MSLGTADNVHVLNVAQVLPDRTTAVTAVRVVTIGAEVRVIAVGGGIVAVYDLASSRVIATHARHKGADVTCVAVDALSGIIISGDDRGAVFVADCGLVAGPATASSGGLASGLRSLFKSTASPAATASGSSGPVRDMPAAPVYGLDPAAPIVDIQLAPTAGSSDLLCAISTTTRACLLRIPPSARGPALASLPKGALDCISVGKKPRDGDFSATFELASCSPSLSAAAPPTDATTAGKCADTSLRPHRRLAFAARPAKRMWIVDADAGTVLSTIK